MINEKKKVAPNAYNTDPAFARKIHGVYLGQNKTPSLGLLSFEEYAKYGTPAPNHYNTQKDGVLSQVAKVPSANMKRDMTVRSPERKKDNSPSPHHYQEKDKNWKLLAGQTKIPSFTVKKDKSHYLDAHIREKKKVPGVGAYKQTGIENYKKLYTGSPSHRRF